VRLRALPARVNGDEPIGGATDDERRLDKAGALAVG